MGVIFHEFDHKLPWNEMKPTLGLRFEHPEQLKKCMTNYGVANGYQLWYRRNDYRSLFVLCGRGLGEGRSGGKKDHYEKVKACRILVSPSKKGVQGQSAADKGKAEDLQGVGKCAAMENVFLNLIIMPLELLEVKPLITMLEEIRVYLMQRLYSMHNLASNLVDSITPSIRKEIERLKEAQRFWIVYPCGNNKYEIRKGDTLYGVNIENRTCACKWWDLSGVPCVHSVAAFSFLKMDPVLGVSAWYSKKMWENAYSYFIRPVGGSTMWTNTPEEPPLPLVLKKMPGPSIADPTNSEAGDMDETVTEDPIEESQVDDIPTQQSKTGQKTAKIIEDAIATRKLKTAGLKRRCKSERIAKRAKPFQFVKDGAGSCADKAWDVDEVLAEE
ncbi:60S ribosomal protein L34 [Tanacetum coccineum]